MILLNSTEEALAFGEKASQEDVELMHRIRKVLVNAFDNILEEEDGDLNLASEIATQGQLMREAIEVSAYA